MAESYDVVVIGGGHNGFGFNCAGVIADDLGVKKWWLR